MINTLLSAITGSPLAFDVLLYTSALLVSISLVSGLVCALNKKDVM